MQMPYDLDLELVRVYRAWDKLEGSSGINIVDFDLAPASDPLTIKSREEVAKRLEELFDASSQVDPPMRELVKGRLRASLVLLSELAGNRLPFERVIKQTLGISTCRFDDNALGRQRNIVECLLGGQNVKRRWSHLAYDASHVDRFTREFIVRHAFPNLSRHFEFYREKWIPVLLRHVRVPLETYNVEVSFAQEDAYWKNWISGDLKERRLDLRINTHPRQVWYQGSAETLVLHEYCGHAVQMLRWHQEIETGKLPKFCGILTVHFPDQYLLEGLAEAVAYFLPDGVKLEPKSEVLRELNYHYLMVMNNVHIMANETGPDAAFAYGHEKLPFTSAAVLEHEIRDRTQNVVNRIYQYVYGIAKFRFMSALGKLGTHKWELLDEVYARPMTPAQFHARADSLAHGIQSGTDKHGHTVEG